MPHAQPAPPAATSTTIPPDLPSGYKDPQWERDLDNGKVWKVRDQRNRPLSLRLIRLDADGPMGAKEFRSRDICRKIGPYGDLLDYRDAWVRSPDGELIHESRFSTWEPPTWEGLELFVVMEWTERSLADRLNESKSATDSAAGLPLEDLLELMACVAAGLDDLRGQGVIHTDVSPANLLLIGKQVRVADYGGITSPTRFRNYAKTEPFGIAYYCAPGLELRDPQFGDDQYALAVVYYHLRTNSLPFPGSGPFTAEHARQTHDTDSLQFPAVSPAERKILNRVTLGQKPYDSCQELVDSLRTAAKSGGGVSSSVIQLPPPDALDSPPTAAKSGSDIIAPVVPLPPLVSTESVPPSQLLITTGASTIRSISGKGADSTAEMPALGSLAFSEAELLKIQMQANKFYEALSRGSVENWEPFLAGLDGRLRAAALAELAVTHLAHRWAKGEEPPVEFYLTKYPELGPANRAPAKLILEEHHCKMKAGHPPDLDGIRRRFPHQYEQIEAELQASLNVTPLTGSPATRSGPKSTTGSGRSEAVLSVSQEYEFLNVLGRGQFGEVWLARKKGSGIEKAIKILLQNQDHEGAQREQRSLELIKNLRHPYLLATEDFWVSDNRLHIVMELADGSLRSRFKEYRAQQLPGIPEDELLPYIVEAAEGLDFLHSQKVTHRDVKPDNLLLLHGHTKVADFGLAKQQDSSQSTGSLCGTPAYMAPESWGNSSSSASDQYSLAFCYAELRQGKLPISGKLSFQEIMFAHLDGRFDFDSILSAGEQVVLRKAMSRLPADRYKSCMEFVENLGRALGRSVNRKTPSTRIPKPAPRSGPGSQADPAPVPAPLPNSAHKSTLLPPEPGTATFVPGTVVTDAVREAPKSAHTPAAWSVKPGTAPMPALRSSHLNRPRPKRSGAQKVMAGTAVLAFVGLIGVGAYVYLKPPPPPPPSIDLAKVKAAAEKLGQSSATAIEDANSEFVAKVHGAGRSVGELSYDSAERERITIETHRKAGELAAATVVPPPPVRPGPGWLVQQITFGLLLDRSHRAALKVGERVTAEIPPPPLADFKFIAKLVAAKQQFAKDKPIEVLKPLHDFVTTTNPPASAAKNELAAFDLVKADLPELFAKDDLRPVSLKSIETVCDRIKGIDSISGPQCDEVRDFYRTLMSHLLKQWIANPSPDDNWNDPKAWERLKNSLAPLQGDKVIDPVLLQTVLDECDVMMESLGKPVAASGEGNAACASTNGASNQPAGKNDPELQPYYTYVAAVKKNPPDRGAANDLADLTEKAKGPQSVFLNPARKRLAGMRLLQTEKDVLKHGSEPDNPYPAPGEATDARRWMKAACELLKADPTLAPKARVKLVIAAAFPKPEPTLVTGMDVPKTDDQLNAFALEPPERIRYWLAYARTRDEASFADAVTGYDYLVALVAVDLKVKTPERLDFDKKVAREYLLLELVKRAGDRQDKDRAAKPLVTLARAFFQRRPLMSPENPDQEADVVIAADLAKAAAQLNPIPNRVAVAGLFLLEAGRDRDRQSLALHRAKAEELLGKNGPGPQAELHAYIGRVQYIRGDLELEWAKKLDHLHDANKHLTLALDAVPKNEKVPSDLTLLRTLIARDLARANIEIANKIGFRNPKPIPEHLKLAAKHAVLVEAESGSDPHALDIHGCVLEDQAWLAAPWGVATPDELKERVKLFEAAIKKFEMAAADDGRSGLGLVRSQALLHLGRCIYKFAQAFPTRPDRAELLEKARTNLRTVSKKGLPGEKAQAHYWLAMIEFLPASISRSDYLIARLLPEHQKGAPRPAVVTEAIQAAKAHLKELREVPIPGGLSDYQLLGLEWDACLSCDEALATTEKSGAEAASPLQAIALDQLDQLAKTMPLHAALRRVQFLYYQLRLAILNKNAPAELAAIWKQLNRDESLCFCAAEENPLRDEPLFLELQGYYYRSRSLTIPSLNLPNAGEAQQFLDCILQLGRKRSAAGFAPHFVVFTLERIGIDIARDNLTSSKQATAGLFAARAFRATVLFDPELTDTGRIVASVPATTGGWRKLTAEWIMDDIIVRIKKDDDPAKKQPQDWIEDAILADEVLGQAKTICARDPSAKAVAAKADEYRDQYRKVWVQFLEPAAKEVETDQKDRAKVWRELDKKLQAK